MWACLVSTLLAMRAKFVAAILAEPEEYAGNMFAGASRSCINQEFIQILSGAWREEINSTQILVDKFNANCPLAKR